MSRTDVLVDADWVEAHLDDPKVVLVEVDEDTSAYDKNHIRGAVRIDWKDDLQDPVRRDFVNKAQFEALLSAQGHRQRRHRRALRRQQQLVRRLRVLVLQAVRPRGRQAARRRPQEVGARLPRAGRPTCPTRPATTYTRQGPGHLDPRLPRRGRSPRSARRTSSTCARPTSSPASCSPRRTCRRSSRSAAGHIPTAKNIPWSQGRQRRRHLQVRRGADGAVRRRGRRPRPRTPSRTAASASARRTPGSCCTSCSASRT